MSRVINKNNGKKWRRIKNFCYQMYYTQHTSYTFNECDKFLKCQPYDKSFFSHVDV